MWLDLIFREMNLRNMQHCCFYYFGYALITSEVIAFTAITWHEKRKRHHNAQTSEL